MLENARLKLTAYYLTIIMIILVFFSLIIYRGAASELDRIERLQILRRPGSVFVIDPDIIKETKYRILTSLVILNSTILVLSGILGYFLAGKTLEPIQKNIEEQKDFVANASHELRTPLTALKTEIEINLRDPKVKNKEILKSNLEEVNKMKKLTDYLLKQSKFQNISHLEMAKVSLKEIVLDAIGKSKFVTHLDASVVDGDRDSLTELTSILLDNAKKYGGTKKLPIVTVKDNVLSVQDFGDGIQENEIDHIFEKFYRADKSRSKEGYGLGLAIAKQIAHVHSAKIKVESKVGVGSVFKVIFS